MHGLTDLVGQIGVMTEQELKSNLARIQASKIIGQLFKMWPEDWPFTSWRFKMINRESAAEITEAVAKYIEEYPDLVEDAREKTIRRNHDFQTYQNVRKTNRR